VVKWAGEKAERGRERWAKLVLAAVKVSRRSWAPEVWPVAGTAELADRVRAWRGAGALVLVLHEDAEDRFVEAVRSAALDLSGDSEVVLVVGPEGGIAPEEIAALTEAGAKPVLLGSGVLRSSAAGPAAIAALNALTGRW
jgi:16S rRNA (uracil1498-N3)-methyltransferase